MTSQTTIADSPSARLHDEALLPLRDVEQLVGLKRSAISVRVRAGSFPKPIRLSSTCTRYRAADIREWLAQRAAESQAAA